MGPRAVAGGWGAGRSVQPCLPSPLRAGDQRRAQKGCGAPGGPRRPGGRCVLGMERVELSLKPLGLYPTALGPSSPAAGPPTPGRAPPPAGSAPSSRQPPRPPAPSSLCALQALSRPLWTAELLRPLPAAGPGPLSPGLDPRPLHPPGQSPPLWLWPVGWAAPGLQGRLGCPPRAGTLMLPSPPHAAAG